MWTYRGWTYRGVDVSRASRNSAMGLRWEAYLTGDPTPLLIRADTKGGMRRLIDYYLTRETKTWNVHG